MTGKAGANVFKLTAPSSSLSYIRSDPITVTPGETYVASAMFCMNTVAASGTVDSTRARRIQIVDAATSNSLALSNQGAASVSSAMSPLSLEVTIPAGVTSVWVRLWLGSTVGNAYWDAVKFAVKGGGYAADLAYIDGAQTATTKYTYAWSGTAHASTSTRTDISNTNRDSDAFTWDPGESLWDFVQPLVEASGLRLFCDSSRKWHLVDPATWSVAGTVTIAQGSNVTVATDTISRNSDEWFDSVVIKYSWLNARSGLPSVRYDSAGSSGGKTLLIEKTKPFPGAGAAASFLTKAAGRGRVVDPEAISDYTAEPAKGLSVSLPSSPVQTGKVSAVTWRFPDGTMTIKSRDLA